MSDSYIPAQDAQALLWMQAFSGGISANPAMFGLTAADAAGISAAVASYQSALSTATTPTTRTPTTVEAKDAARNSAEQICRQFAILIKYNDGISDEDKIGIGVRPVNTDRDPVNVPSTSPMLNIVAATQGAQTLRYSDSLTPDSRARPFGAANLQLFVAVADEEVTDPSQAQFYGAFTRNPIGVDFSAVDDGKKASFFGRWASAKGDVGPWSVPVSMSIAA